MARNTADGTSQKIDHKNRSFWFGVEAIWWHGSRFDLAEIVWNERKHGNKVAKRTIDRNPSENGQELTGLVEGSCPYRYKTGGWRVRCR